MEEDSTSGLKFALSLTLVGGALLYIGVNALRSGDFSNFSSDRWHVYEHPLIHGSPAAWLSCGIGGVLLPFGVVGFIAYVTASVHRDKHYW